MRILFISHNRLGDSVLSTGLLNHLSTRHPEARLTIACGPVAAPLFEAVPNLERIIPLKKAPRLGHWRQLWRQTVATRWDLVIDLRGSLIPWLLRATARHVLRASPETKHKVVALAQAMTLDPPPEPKIWWHEAHAARARELLPGGGPVLALGPTANWNGKCWPAERFADLAARLSAPNGPLPGARIAVCGAAGERDTVAALIAQLQTTRQVHWLGGEHLLTLAAALGGTSLYVGNDSGLMHLAAATGAPTLGLFGPSREELYRPWGEHASVVRGARSYEEIRYHPDYDFRRPDCWMLDLETDTAVEAAEALLQRASAIAGTRQAAS